MIKSSGGNCMRVKYLLYTDIATNMIKEKFLEYRYDYAEDDIEFANVLFSDLKQAKEGNYQLLFGTMIINYVEMYHILLPDDESFVTLLKYGELEEIVSYLEKDVDLFLEVVEATMEKSDLDEHERENYYQMTINSDFANIYSRFDPCFELDYHLHENNFPTEHIKCLEYGFYDHYETLKSVLEYPEHITYVLTDLIDKKYTKEDAYLLVGTLLESYYFFTKGKELLQDKTITSKDKKLLNKLEEANSLEQILPEMMQRSNLSRVVECCCYYQDHLFDTENLILLSNAQNNSYMKKFPKKAKDQT